MKIFVNARPNSKENKVEKKGDFKYSVKLKKPAKDNKANLALIDVLAEFFCVSRRRVRIISGLSSKNKIVEITGT